MFNTDIEKSLTCSVLCPSLAIATSNVDDVRTVLDFYRKEDDIIEAFKRNQQRLREQEEQQAQIRQQQGSSSQWSGLFGRGLFGGGGNRARSVSRF